MNKTYIRFLIIISCLLGTALHTKAQVTIGDDISPEIYSILQIEGNSGGVRLPQVTLQQRNDLTAILTGNNESEGLTVYNLNSNRIEYWNGSDWAVLPITVAENGLNLTGLNKIKLGGDLAKHTTIEGATNSLYFDNTTGEFNIGPDLVVIKDGKIGIGTTTPQSLLHIDAKSDNSATPDSAQLSNDIIIDHQGKIGVGIMPEATDPSPLQVNGPLKFNNIGNMTIGNTYLLTTDDGSGQVKWKKNVSLTKLVVGQAGGGYGGYVNTNAYTTIKLELPPGEWIIQTTLLLVLRQALAGTQYLWGTCYWAETQTATMPSPDVISGKNISGLIPGVLPVGIAFGLTYVKNTTEQEKTYYLMMRAATGNYPATLQWFNVGGGNWGENSIVAFPVVGAITD